MSGSGWGGVLCFSVASLWAFTMWSGSAPVLHAFLGFRSLQWLWAALCFGMALCQIQSVDMQVKTCL